MSLTISQARDEIFSRIRFIWQPTAYKMVWPDKPEDKPTGRVPWARTALRHAFGGQASLADGEGAARWSRQGLLAVQIFTPVGQGLTQGYDLAQVVLDGLEGYATPGGVWFRGTRINEVGPDGGWFQLNVISEFTYDEVK